MSRLSLGSKLAAAFGVTLLLLLAVTAVAVTRMGALADRTADAKRGAVLDEQIMSMEIAAREALDVEASALLYGAPSTLDDRLKAAWTTDDGDAFAESLAEAQRLAVLEMPRRLRDSAAAATQLQGSITRTLELVRAGDLDAARANRRSTSLPAFDTFTELNQAVETNSEAFSEAASVGAAEAASGGKRTVILVALFALLIAAASATLIIRGVTRGVRAILDRLGSLREHDTADLSGGLAAIAAGDLTRTLSPTTLPLEHSGGDEIARVARAVDEIRATTAHSIADYNEMRAQLATLVGELATSAGTVSSASQHVATSSDEAGRAVGEIASALTDVAQGAERQVRMVESTREAVQEASRAASTSAQTAQDTASAAEEARRLAADGVAAAGDASDAIRQVAEASELAGRAIHELSQRSERIGGIVTTITGLAEQTNLLALNAAIEAARAGEQGRGFAVVAEEVRKLAEESQAAAGQIAELVSEIQAETVLAVNAVGDGAQRTQHGVATVERTRAAFEAIGGSVGEVSARVGEIAAAVQQISAEAGRAEHDVAEVAAVAEQSSASAEQVSASTQETSASAQEIAASAQELAQTAEHLNGLVGRFTVAT
ncbi:methyl-accepting chemotaxis protein [Solirubrobacter sp. CPCC 204708]|uniref:Methyl-accepting chemotaxis protein n=1 Tax=Solirubrobacter deserti TaxID=2282478 RepID=A0ABT4RSH2_9ACTN|nr:methyl-accepting chemotaxis protein [Solirubrobacter deserti]MBE2316377.1 methyl-accepting chemotaxis protein [Solirubrobacter deserti]MDA0141543.1 methyl-accepting chemotaxis protein [Solirubrobacter deserti]